MPQRRQLVISFHVCSGGTGTYCTCAAASGLSIEEVAETLRLSVAAVHRYGTACKASLAMSSC
jgi:hypothetical protein